MEIGAGFNTPVVTRFLSEAIIRDISNSKLVRINLSDSECPNDISGYSIGISLPALEALNQI